jgi:hypothetical protein
LFQDAVQSPRRKIVAGLAGDGLASGLFGMLELAMASLGNDQAPTVLLQEDENFPDLYRL